MHKVQVGYYEADEETYSLTRWALRSGRISYGPMCREVEEVMAHAHDSKYGIVSASGTDSLRAALHAMKIVHGWKDGDKVIVPATTFVATLNIVYQVGLVPVLVDVIPQHYTMDPSKIDEKIQSTTRAIIPVNLLGQAANLSTITSIASEYDLKVIEDSCEAMFVKHRGAPVGCWGDIGCFSFYMAHLITAGVGGLAVTSDGRYADVMRSLLNHGRDTVYVSIDDDNDLDREELDRVVRKRFSFVNMGYSSRMTELQAAIAIPQINNRSDMLYKRRAVAEKLTDRLSKHEIRGHITLPEPAPGNEHSWMMYGITTTEPARNLIQHLERSGVETRDLLPILGQPVYRFMFDEDEYPVASHALSHAFYIGCHQGMTNEDIDIVGEAFDHYFGG